MRNQKANPKRGIAVALLVCILMLTVLAVRRSQLDNRAKHFARAFVATTQADVQVSLPEQIIYSMFYSASRADEAN